MNKQKYNEIMKLLGNITDGKWGIGHINDDFGIMDIISTDQGEIIAEDVAEHNAVAIVILPLIAEMLKEIMEKNKELKSYWVSDVQEMSKIYEQQQAKIERYEAALRFYAEGGHFKTKTICTGVYEDTVLDAGGKATIALKGE